MTNCRISYTRSRDRVDGCIAYPQRTRRRSTSPTARTDCPPGSGSNSLVRMLPTCPTRQGGHSGSRPNNRTASADRRRRPESPRRTDSRRPDRLHPPRTTSPGNRRQTCNHRQSTRKRPASHRPSRTATRREKLPRHHRWKGKHRDGGVRPARLAVIGHEERHESRPRPQYRQTDQHVRRRAQRDPGVA
jgi:hypothetical protein